MASDENLAPFISATFRSIWGLEVLCLLLKRPREGIAPQKLVAELRANDLIVRMCLAELTAAGLVQITDGEARYSPATAELDRLAKATVDRYAKAPDAVRRIVVRAATSDLTAFTDAFWLRGKP